MMIEENVFKRSSLNINKLIPFGFKKENDKYIYSKLILDDTFRVDIEIDNKGLVKGKIIELAINEEYNNYRIENLNGKFVNKIREEYEKILKDIKDNCFTEKYFISEQANRITNLIIEKYKDVPEFPWSKFPGYGVFRNQNNEKWYAIIMNINKDKIDRGIEEVEIINVKLAEDEVKDLLSKKIVYEAYHMNKKNWISIILDDTLTDDWIMNCVIKSHKLTENLKNK